MLAGERDRGRKRCGAGAVLGLTALTLGCAGEPHQALAPATKPAVVKTEPSPPVEAAEPPLDPLRTGALEPVTHPVLELSVLRHADAGAYELVELALPSLATLSARSSGDNDWIALETLARAYVALEPARGGFAFVATGAEAREGVSTPHVWIRRKKSRAPLSGTIYSATSWSGRGHVIPFHAALDAAKAATPKLEQAWAAAAVDYFAGSASVVDAFAAARLRARYLAATGPKRATARVKPFGGGGELSGLMDMTTGRLAVEHALEQNRELYLAFSRQKPSVALEKLAPPNLARHPWAEMSAELGTQAPDEPLARATPAEFYFVRARDFGKLLELLDLADDFGEPAADLLDGHAEVRGTLVRYEAELGLSRSALTRVLGPSVVSELALVGSDPYLHEGSDLTLIFRVKNHGLFGAALGAALAGHAALHPGVAETTFTEGGVTVNVHRSADGRVRQHRATVGDLELVSNSPAAVRRVLETLAGKHPSLADEPDFRYMGARDRATPNDELLYLGDRFVASVVGPAQKIAETRRLLAQGELLTPGFAALTYGLVNGRSPAKTQDLLQAKLLAPTELKHADGSPIDWQPGRAAHSSWGTPAALEPLIDRPPLALVTEAEQHGYDAFARSYESEWSDRIDPIALRVHGEPGSAGRQRLVGELRVLPTLRTQYWETIRTVGNVHLVVPPLPAGLACVLGLGEAASLRSELSDSAGMFGLGDRIKLDWLGDYAMVGTQSRNELANAWHGFSHELELPAPDTSQNERFLRSLANLPVYAAIGVRSRLGAGVFLAGLRSIARDAAPGLAKWGAARAYRGNDVVAVTFEEHRISVTLYYSLLNDALAFSLNEAVLHRVIDQLTDHPPVKQAEGARDPNAAQLVQELAAEPESALYRVLGWLATEALVEGAREPRDLAASFLLGTRDVEPQAADGLMQAYLGALVVTPEGKPYVLGPDGVRDPLRGSASAPSYPALPVPNSPVARVLTRLASLRSAVSFDDEPSRAPRATPLQSFHARVTLELRGTPDSGH